MIETLRKTVTNHTWIYALPAGLISAALVVANSPQPGVLNYGIIFWAGLLGGLLTLNGSNLARKIGFQTGVVGSLPVVWNMSSAFEIVSSFDQPLFAGVVQTALLVTGTLIAVIVVGVVGAVGAAIGGWLSQRFASKNYSAVSS